jgi:hypothetical protein
MANTAKALFRGAATTTTSTVLYTVPASTTAVITSIVVTNTSATAYTFTMSLDDVAVHTATTINGNSTLYIDSKQVLATAKTIKGGASNTAVNFHISGMEIA